MLPPIIPEWTHQHTIERKAAFVVTEGGLSPDQRPMGQARLQPGSDKQGRWRTESRLQLSSWP